MKEDRMNKFRKTEEGFTLIELMIVIAIIGILAAIAIPQFAAYRERSYNSAAQADLRNAATAQEAYFVDRDRYADARSDLTGPDYGLFLSENVTLNVDSANTWTYVMTSWHQSVEDVSWVIRGPGGSLSKVE